MMWQIGWRENLWSDIKTQWDLIIIGGGITGAGIFYEATQLGLKSLLIDAGDFASGTSSRSSKMVHGGLRYLRNAQIRMTNESVHEREMLLKGSRGLVNPLSFLMVNYNHDKIPWWVFGFGLAFYDLLALKWSHRRYNAVDILKLCPYLNQEGLIGGFRYVDAQTDDARLVLRIIKEAVADGGTALNYARAVGLLRNNKKQVCGVVIEDTSDKSIIKTVELKSKVVINASGAWADELRSFVDKKPKIRKLRGSHIFFPENRLPLSRAITALHPSDGRPVYALPWEGVILVGTTDVDHNQPSMVDPSISEFEINYLMTFVNSMFPSKDLTRADITSTMSGIRPVIDTGKKNPSQESREYIIWNEDGLITVAGGKLTTYRLMAYDTLKIIRHVFGFDKPVGEKSSLFRKKPPISNTSKLDSLEPAQKRRLIGRYGPAASYVADIARTDELTLIPGTNNLWAELRYAAREEGVVHLDDLLLRRIRIGITLQHGGMKFIYKIKHIVQSELNWTEKKWEYEVEEYIKLINRSYSYQSRS